MRFRFRNILYFLVIPLYVFGPSLPYIEYILNKGYIVENFCIERNKQENSCNGKCYLHEQLNKQAESEDSDKDQSKIVPDRKLDDHLQAFLIFPGIFETGKIVSYRYSVRDTIQYIKGIFVPPRS